MGYRNPSPAVRTGVTPQVYGDKLTDKLNLEAASQIADLQAKTETTAPAADAAPSSASRYYQRQGAPGWPYVTGAVSVTAGNPDVTLPSSGFTLGTLYKGEQVHVELFVELVTASGAVYVNLDLLGSAGQGSAAALVDRAQPFLPASGVSGRTWFSGAVFTLSRKVEGATLRFQVGSAGGSIAIPNGAPMWQRYAIFTPLEAS